MTLLIPLLLRLTTLFERGTAADETASGAQVDSEEVPAIIPEKE